MSLPPGLPADWPQRALSRWVPAGGLHWHVQVAGLPAADAPPEAAPRPVLVLLHGTGASAHSWAEMLPALAEQATVVVPDLPGHGWTRNASGLWRPAELSLPHIVRGLAALLAALKLPAPTALAGHSAGAALALRWALDIAATGQPAPQVLGFAPSLVPPPALYTQWLAPWVTPLATSALVAGLTARLLGPTGLVDKLLDSTGSTLSAAQRGPYRTLFADPAHVRGSSGFMAAADLPRLLADGRAAAAAVRCAFVLGERDTWVPGAQLLPVIQRHLPRAELAHWAGGHLVHEERPAEAAAWLLRQMQPQPKAAPMPEARAA